MSVRALLDGPNLAPDGPWSAAPGAPPFRPPQQGRQQHTPLPSMLARPPKPGLLRQGNREPSMSFANNLALGWLQ